MSPVIDAKDGSGTTSSTLLTVGFVLLLAVIPSVPAGASTGSPRSVDGAVNVAEPPYRAFQDASWWNTPLPVDAPEARRSALWMADLAATTKVPWLRLTGLPDRSPDVALPMYVSQPTDPAYTVVPARGPVVTIHIPLGATPTAVYKPKMVVFDTATDQGVGLFDVHCCWTAGGVDRYYLSSEGLHYRAGGTYGNEGHRGAPMVEKSPRLVEVTAGWIAHRTECYVPPRQVGIASVWPMVGSDGNLKGGIPEGVVLRIRPTVDLSTRGLSPAALVLAHMLQDYGCMVSDGGAPAEATLKLERADWSATGLTGDSLSSLLWSDWEFVRGRPAT